MTDTTTEEVPKKASRLPFILGLILALVGGGGSFYAVYSGMILGPAPAEEMHSASDRSDETRHPKDAVTVDRKDAAHSAATVAFVPIDPLMISLGPNSRNAHLRFRAQLEVPAEHEDTVRKLMPRVVDVLNGYLRAVETADFENPAILPRLRGQMLRRVQVVVGTEAVHDLLIMEFVLN